MESSVLVTDSQLYKGGRFSSLYYMVHMTCLFRDETINNQPTFSGLFVGTRQDCIVRLWVWICSKHHNRNISDVWNMQSKILGILTNQFCSHDCINYEHNSLMHTVHQDASFKLKMDVLLYFSSWITRISGIW